jgi:hypothetical protein
MVGQPAQKKFVAVMETKNVTNFQSDFLHRGQKVTKLGDSIELVPS